MQKSGRRPFAKYAVVLNSPEHDAILPIVIVLEDDAPSERRRMTLERAGPT